MTKKIFLNKLKSKLSTLDGNEVNLILKKYENIIDEEVKKGGTEKEVINALGDIDLISKLYLKMDKKPNVNSKQEKEASLNTIIDSIIKWIDDGFKKIDDALAKRILLIFCFILFAIIGLSLLHLPFKIMTVLGQLFFRFVFADYYFYRFIILSWSVSLNICYLLLVVWLTVKYINKIIDHQTNTNYKKSTKESIEDIKNKDEDANKMSDSPFEILYLILKAFVVLLTIPLVIFEVMLFIILLFTISLIISGVIISGPSIFIIGLMLMIAIVINLVYKVMFKGGIK
ncbi:MAG: DUF1700 domain-containing protein [Bacilli bacterium]|nr:DUF1700 domain-containing protein [Bacilli bacterium]